MKTQRECRIVYFGQKCDNSLFRFYFLLGLILLLSIFFFFVIYSVFVFAMLSCLYLACSLVVTCWERADVLALPYMYVMFSCVFVTFPYGVLGQVWYLIVSIPDIFIFSHFLDYQQWKVTSKSCNRIPLFSKDALWQAWLFHASI